MIKIGSLWKSKPDSKTKHGGKIDIPADLILRNNMRIITMPNKSQNERSPEFDIFIVSDQSNESSSGGLPMQSSSSLGSDMF